MIYNPYQNYTPYNQTYGNYPSNNFSQSPTSLVRVNGIEGAKAYQMSANSTAALFDNSDDIMYIKITDGANFGTIRTFRFSEIKDNTPNPKSEDYISREEFNQFKEEVMNYGKQFVQSNIQTSKSATIKSNQSNSK